MPKNSPLDVSKTLAASNDATDWVEVLPEDSLRISIATGLTGTINIESSFDGSTALTPPLEINGITDFSGGAQLSYTSGCREHIRIKAPTVSSGSAVVAIRRN